MLSFYQESCRSQVPWHPSIAIVAFPGSIAFECRTSEVLPGRRTMPFAKGIGCCLHHNCLLFQVRFRVGVFEQKVTPWGICKQVHYSHFSLSTAPCLCWRVEQSLLPSGWQTSSALLQSGHMLSKEKAHPYPASAPSGSVAVLIRNAD